jgi:hypothetical protein
MVIHIPHKLIPPAGVPGKGFGVIPDDEPQSSEDVNRKEIWSELFEDTLVGRIHDPIRVRTASDHLERPLDRRSIIGRGSQEAFHDELEILTEDRDLGPLVTIELQRMSEDIAKDPLEEFGEEMEEARLDCIPSLTHPDFDPEDSRVLLNLAERFIAEQAEGDPRLPLKFAVRKAIDLLRSAGDPFQRTCKVASVEVLQVIEEIGGITRLLGDQGSEIPTRNGADETTQKAVHVKEKELGVAQKESIGGDAEVLWICKGRITPRGG